ncbi:hypothetical protein ONZ51_g11220 [Trametes cubensis]|uniref:Uncharacterized protein n=1 Tax=Trametes cubensis TaxID=1111947 RepID=A0AAD7TIK1_9APHY|nr:hypothetical protein ONZ51_g11220 [Trametes cubensis]
MSNQGSIRVLFSSENAFFAWDPMTLGVDAACLSWIRIHIAVADFALDTLRSMINKSNGAVSTQHHQPNMRMMTHVNANQSKFSLTVSVPRQGGSTIGYIRFLTYQDYERYIYALAAMSNRAKASVQSSARAIMLSPAKESRVNTATGTHSQGSSVDKAARVAATSPE